MYFRIWAPPGLVGRVTPRHHSSVEVGPSPLARGYPVWPGSPPAWSVPGTIPPVRVGRLPSRLPVRVGQLPVRVGRLPVRVGDGSGPGTIGTPIPYPAGSAGYSAVEGGEVLDGMILGSIWATSSGWFPTVPDGSGMVPATMTGSGGGRGPRFFAKSTVLIAMKSGG